MRPLAWRLVLFLHLARYRSGKRQNRVEKSSMMVNLFLEPGNAVLNMMQRRARIIEYLVYAPHNHGDVVKRPAKEGGHPQGAEGQDDPEDFERGHKGKDQIINDQYPIINAKTNDKVKSVYHYSRTIAPWITSSPDTIARMASSTSSDISVRSSAAN